MNTVFCKVVIFTKEKHPHKVMSLSAGHAADAFAAHHWPREDLSLPPPKPFNTHPTAAKTADCVTKGNICKLWPGRIV